MAFPKTRNTARHHGKFRGMLARQRGWRIGLTLRDVRCDPIANRALDLLMHDYTVSEEQSRLVLTKKTGDLKLFVHELDDLRQLDFIHHQAMVRQIERLRTLLTASNEYRERWKVRAFRGAGARSHCQNRQQWWPRECQRHQICGAQALSR